MTDYKILCEDEKLVRLARKRVKEKQRLIRYVFLYIFATIFLFCAIYATAYEDFLEGIFFGIWIGISALVTVYIVKYIVQRLRITKKDPIEAEYEKLKRMGNDELIREFNKMSL